MKSRQARPAKGSPANSGSASPRHNANASPSTRAASACSPSRDRPQPWAANVENRSESDSSTPSRTR